MATTTTTLRDRIAQALTENTGTHFLDSGGENGRAWQRNAGKTAADFAAEPRATVDQWGITISTFHYLADALELADDHPAAELLADIADTHPAEPWGEIVEILREYVEAEGGTTTETWNTYNHEWDRLSQVLQGFTLTMPDDERAILCVQIHNGADVRGGYTRPYLFAHKRTGSDPDYTDSAFLYAACDAHIWCDADACDFSAHLHGGDAYTADGDPAECGDLQACPACHTPSALRADFDGPDAY